MFFNKNTSWGRWHKLLFILLSGYMLLCAIYPMVMCATGAQLGKIPNWTSLRMRSIVGCSSIGIKLVSLWCLVAVMSMGLAVLVAGLYKACVGWLARVMYGGPLHKAGARLLYLPSLARMSFLWSYLGKKNWYDRVDDTVILGALPFRSQTKEVC